MKKLVALILTLAMMLCVGTAFATEAEPEQTGATEAEPEQTGATEAEPEQTGATEINWADLEEQGAETIAQGNFVTFDEIAVKMWIPNALAAVELTDDDKAQGYIGYYQPEDGSAAIAVMYVDADGMTLDEYKEKLTEAAATEMEDVVINGMEAVSYVLEESDTACVSFVTEAGYIFEVSGSPKSDENFAALLSMVMASIQAE